MKDQIKNEMLEAIFTQTGGRDENAQMAEICADIAMKFISTKDQPPSELIALKKYYDSMWEKHYSGCWSTEQADAERKSRRLKELIDNITMECINT